MLVLRSAAAAAVGLSLVIAGHAGAAPKPKPKPVCNLVTDSASDVTAPGDASQEILSADIASDAKNFTTVVRLKGIKATGVGQLGKEVRIDFTLPGGVAKAWMGWTSSVYGGDTFQYGLIGQGAGGSTSPTGDAAGSIDVAKNELRMTVPTSAMNELGKAKVGNKVTDIVVTASQLVGVAPNPSGAYAFFSESVDSAEASAAYTTGTPSCVKPG